MLREAVFIHIPKTSGTSVRTSVGGALAKLDYQLFYDYGARRLTTPWIADAPEGVPPYAVIRQHADPGRGLFLAGHFRAGKYITGFHPKSFFTFVRDPFDRLYSSYSHLRALHGYREGFDEFIKDEGRQNLQSKAIAGIEVGDIGFIGLAEKLNEEIPRLSIFLGVPLRVFKINAGKYDEDHAETKSRMYERVRAANAQDFELYEKVVELRMNGRVQNEPRVLRMPRARAFVAAMTRHMPTVKPPIEAAPPPLVSLENKLIVLWSAKSACTTAYVWFAGLCGFVDEMRQHHVWPHNHRTSIYYGSDGYRSSLRSDLSQCHVLKIIRDPYSRAVSIYRHALQTKFAEADMKRFSRGKLDASTGYSFQQFLDLVVSLDRKRCNIHYRPQRHPYELVRKADTIINISKADLFKSLNEFEAARGYAITDFHALDWLHSLEGPRRAKAMAMDADRVDEMPFSRHMVRNLKLFPPYDRLLTPLARAKIEKIYKDDFEAYGDYL